MSIKLIPVDTLVPGMVVWDPNDMKAQIREVIPQGRVGYLVKTNQGEMVVPPEHWFQVILEEGTQDI